MSNRYDEILPHLLLSNKRLFGLRKAWLFTGNNIADDSSWQTWWWLGYTTKKTPYCSQKHNTGQNFHPSLHSGWAAFTLSPCYYHKHFRHIPETSGTSCSSSTTHQTLSFIQTTGQVSTGSPQAADSSWLLLHWLGLCQVSKAESSSVLHPELRPAW